MRGIRHVASLAMALPFLLSCWDGALLPFGNVPLQDFDSTFVFTYRDFNADGLHPLEPPPAGQRIGPLFYRAEVPATDTGLASAPMSLWVTVSARNDAADTVALPVRGCTVWPEVYADPAPLGAPLWVPAGECMQAPYTTVIAPGAVAEYSFLAYDVMLARALADGRYYFTARFRRQTDSLAFVAGSGDVRLRVPGLAYRVQVQREGRQSVRAAVTATNRNDAPTLVTYGDCALTMKVYRDADRRELVAVWRAHDVCLAYLAGALIDPGSSVRPEEFTRVFTVSKLKDDGVEPGGYHLSVCLEHDWREYEFAVGVLEI